MTKIAEIFLIFIDTMKSYTTEFLVIININIRLFNIVMKLSGVTYMTITVMIIININIIFYNIITIVSGVKYIIITIIISFITNIIIAIINIMKLVLADMRKSLTIVRFILLVNVSISFFS